MDVIVTSGTAASRAARQATPAIPIVIIAIGDPVRAGLVASLARPGWDITGNTILGTEVSAKRLQLFKEVIPADVARGSSYGTRITAPTWPISKNGKLWGPKLGVTLLLRRSGQFQPIRQRFRRNDAGAP